MEVLATSHVHSKWSYDGSWSLEALSAKFSRRGCRLLMMTEHDRGFTAARHGEYREACARASSDDILVLPGIEYSDPANCVHVLVWGAPFLGEGQSTSDILKAARAAGGVVVFAHPSRRNAWRCYEASWADCLLGIEAWNRKYDGWAPSETAPALLSSAGAIPFVGLDFHTERQSFPLTMALDVPSHVVTEETVLESLRARRCYPRAFGVHFDHVFFRKATAVLSAAEQSRRTVASIARRSRLTS